MNSFERHLSIQGDGVIDVAKANNESRQHPEENVFPKGGVHVLDRVTVRSTEEHGTVISAQEKGDTACVRLENGEIREVSFSELDREVAEGK